jgi:hypothetical protein
MSVDIPPVIFCQSPVIFLQVIVFPNYYLVHFSNPKQLVCVLNWFCEATRIINAAVNYNSDPLSGVDADATSHLRRICVAS